MEKLKQLLGNYNILFVYQTGSQLYSTNCKDIDYVVVVENWNKNYQKFFVDGADYFCYSVAEFYRRQTEICKDMQFSLDIVLGKVVYGANPIAGYNWFLYKSKVAQSILTYAKDMLCGNVFGGTNSVGQKVCSKMLAWAFMAYFVMQNNGFVFTSDQKDILQRCHDHQLPLTFAVDLKQKLLEL